MAEDQRSLLSFLRHKLASWLAPSGMLTEHDYRLRSQKWIDTVCHYRNLAIQLGAPPAHMLNDYDRKLAQNHTSDDPAGWEEDTPELWEELERYEAALRQIAYGAFDVNASAVADLAQAKSKAAEALRV